MSRFAAITKAAGEASPMSNGPVSLIPGRVLLADGDGLAYYCAGNDETDPSKARQTLRDKLASAKRACGAETVKVLLTGRGSHKGHRYAIARTKPYQGQRKSGRRPKNWEHLRDYMEQEYPDCVTNTAEADDLFGRFAASLPDVVIYTQDKDMRMVPGWHLNWLTHLLYYVQPGQFAQNHAEETWGEKWFWLQMLHGDTADNIPGLEYIRVSKDKTKLCGPVTAEAVLSGVTNREQAFDTVAKLYSEAYEKEWADKFLEQAILLWMRNDLGSNWANVMEPGNPLHGLWKLKECIPAFNTMCARVREAEKYAQAEVNGDSGGPPDPAEESRDAVPVVPTPVPGAGSSPGSQPLLGGDQSNVAQIVQCTVGQDRERREAVRNQEPPRIPSWVRHVLAKA